MYQQLSKELTKTFNRLADQVAFNEKAASKLPKCETCGAYCSRLDIHKRYKHNIE